MTLRRFDTLFLRLFVLIWVTLVVSHGVAYVLVVPAAKGPGGPPPGTSHVGDRLDWSRWPTLPSLPPGNPLGAGSPSRQGEPPAGPPPAGPPTGADHSAPALPAAALWTDYGVRMLVIALGALLGARWLSAPVQRLSVAAGTLAQGLGSGRPPQLNEHRGTREVREAARVFNHMATRLQEQFDARGLHMAALSHDLRTPLTRLRMRLEALPDAAAQSATADILEMNAMIEGTLAILREQQDDRGASTVDITAMLQALTDDLAEQGQFVTVRDLPPLHAKAHPTALKRILDNLVGNALRHGGSASLGVAAEGHCVVVHVDDDGPGIAPALMAQAFQPWVRLTPGTGGTGHGLGLAVARDLAERDGAQLTLHNRPEGGLRAALALPMA